MRYPRVCIRISEPDWAQECLQLFDVGEKLNMKKVGDYEEIYKANKQQHFKALQEKTGIAFEDMIFFDNQRNNIQSVSKLNVHCIFCPDGLTKQIWKSGLESFARR